MPEKENKQNAVVPEAKKIRFEKTDFDVLATVLDNHPELKICALALKEARASQLKYPLKKKEAVRALLGKNKLLDIEGHRINSTSIEKYFIDEDFPIADETQLLARVHIALWRCREDITWSLRAPKDANTIINSLTQKS